MFKTKTKPVPGSPKSCQEASILSAQLSFECGQHLAEEGGGFRGGGDCGIEIDERGQRALRGNVVVSKDRLDAAGWAHARIRILDVDLLDQSNPITKPGHEFLERIRALHRFA